MKDMREMLRPADLAERLGVTTGRVYQLIAAGEIPATKVGGSIRIPRDAWQEWIGEQSKRAMAATRERETFVARAGRRERCGAVKAKGTPRC